MLRRNSVDDDDNVLNVNGTVFFLSELAVFFFAIFSSFVFLSNGTGLKAKKRTRDENDAERCGSTTTTATTTAAATTAATKRNDNDTHSPELMVVTDRRRPNLPPSAAAPAPAANGDDGRRRRLERRPDLRRCRMALALIEYSSSSSVNSKKKIIIKHK